MEALQHNFTGEPTIAETHEGQLTAEQQEVLDFMRMCDENVLAAINGTKPIVQGPRPVNFSDEL